MSGPRHRRRLDPDAPLVDLADVLADDELVERLARAAVLPAPGVVDGPRLVVAPIDRSPSGRHAVGRHRATVVTPTRTPLSHRLPRRVVTPEDPLLQDEVFALLQEWRADALTAPLPAVPAVPAALRPVGHWRRWTAMANRVTSPRSVRPALAIGAALAGLLMGSTVVSAKEATPDDALFALTTVFWPADAASQHALVDTRTALSAASEALRAGQITEAVVAADRATESLAHVDPDDRTSTLQSTVALVRAQAATREAKANSEATSTTHFSSTGSGPVTSVASTGSGRAQPAATPVSPAPVAAAAEAPRRAAAAATAGPLVTDGSATVGGAGTDAQTGTRGATAAGSGTPATTVAAVPGDSTGSSSGDTSGTVPSGSAGPATSGSAPTSVNSPTGSGTGTSAVGSPSTSAGASAGGSVVQQPVSGGSGSAEVGGASSGGGPTAGAQTDTAVKAGVSGGSELIPSAGEPASAAPVGPQSEAPPAPQPSPPPAASPDPTSPTTSASAPSSSTRPTSAATGGSASSLSGGSASAVVSPTTRGG